MHSVRRAAWRAAISAPRTLASKAQPTSLVGRALRVPNSQVGVAAIFALRTFSQSARAFNMESAGSTSFSDMESAEGAPDSMAKDPSEHGVFVRNMVFDATEEHLQEIFGQYGGIVACQIARDPRGLSRGYGFVFFQDADAQEKAVATVNGSFWHGRRIAVAKRIPQDGMNRSRRVRGGGGGMGAPTEPTSCLFIGNIPYETTDSELNRLFRDLPGLRDVRVAVDRQSGWPRGFAHCDFTDVPSAVEATKRLVGVAIAGRPLRVDFAAAKGAFGSAGEQPANNIDL